MPSGKKSYSIQIVVILAIFFFVLFALVFRLIVDLRAESIKEKTQQIEIQRLKQQFIANIDDQYNHLLKLYNAKEYEKAIEIIKKFNIYEKSDYQNLSEIKKQVRLYYLKGDYSDSIVWTSHIDGELGKGKKIAVRLSVGEHQITAAATNGITKGSMTTRIFIEKDPDFLKYYRKE
jgi:hypothetical protein